MQKEISSFDRAIWRINGILILGVFLAAAIVTLFSDYNLFRTDYYSSSVRSPVVADASQGAGEQLYLGQFRIAGGSQYSSAPLYSDSERNRSKYPRSSSNIRNYYYYDANAATGTWLFDNHTFLIRDRQTLREGEYRRGEGGKVYGYLYTVVDVDSDKDGLLTERDQSALYISDPSGQGAKKILEGVESILGTEILESGKLFLYTQEKSGDHIYQIDLETLKILNKTVIEIK